MPLAMFATTCSGISKVRDFETAPPLIYSNHRVLVVLVILNKARPKPTCISLIGRGFISASMTATVCC